MCLAEQAVASTLHLPHDMLQARYGGARQGWLRQVRISAMLLQSACLQ